MVMVTTEKYRIRKTGDYPEHWFVLENYQATCKGDSKWSECEKSQNYQEMLILLRKNK